MRYAKIRKMDVSNGEGIGVSLFVQGCHFHCKGCFNSETWDFAGGKQWTPEVENRFIELAGSTYAHRISILGGEPLCDENVFSVCALLRKLRLTYPDKKIWLYTGYTMEEIIDEDSDTVESFLRRLAIGYADIVVDGRFEIEKQDLYNEQIVWAGSTNQRVINTRDLSNI